MAILTQFERLFQYDNWANREVLRSLQGMPEPSARAVKLLAHILSAERLWWERMQARPQTHPVWPQFTLAQCGTEIAELSGMWKQYLAPMGEPDLALPVNYKNTKAETFTSQRQDILMHVVMHSAYHRGQIAAEVRAAGFTPAYTDFIHAVRQGWVKNAQ